MAADLLFIQIEWDFYTLKIQIHIKTDYQLGFLICFLVSLFLKDCNQKFCKEFL